MQATGFQNRYTFLLGNLAQIARRGRYQLGYWSVFFGQSFGSSGIIQVKAHGAL
jgi:hypothetical protein